MTNHIKGIGTDLSGVVISDGFPVVIRECEKSYSLNNGELQAAKNKNWTPFALGEMSYREFWGNTFGDVGLNLSAKEIDSINSRVVNSHKPLDALNTVKKLKSKYEIVGMITNVPKEWFEEWDNSYGLNESFYPLLPSYRVRIRKPDVRIYLKFCEEARLLPSQILYFDDQIKNVHAARQVSMEACQVLSNENPFLRL